MVVYPLPFLVWEGILLYSMKLGARRHIHHQLQEPAVITHLNALTGENQTSVAHGDTLEYLLRRTPYSFFAAIRTSMIRELIRSRVLDNRRLMGEYHRIALDGSGIISYNERHCEHCLTKKSSSTGKTIYYHMVLEAKLVTEDGLAMSVETEFIENEGPLITKQDCELRAFYRLVPRLKKAFPQLPICLLLDGLYAAEPVIKLCEDSHWKYLINFKEGSMPVKYEEFISLCESVQKGNRLSLSLPDNIQQDYIFATGIAHGEQTFNAIRCIEHRPEGCKQYAWITNFTVTQEACAIIANQGGRIRWKIENQGFNVQKNGGYNLEHAYSNHPNASKCHYLLLQIAHTINQLVERGSMLSKETRKKIGSIRNIARWLLESLRTVPITTEEYIALFARPFQIRLRSP